MYSFNLHFSCRLVHFLRWWLILITVHHLFWLIHHIWSHVSPFPQEFRKFLQQLLVQSQFSLGCALSCSLHFLHEGAVHRWLCLILAAALSWFLARKARLLLRHVITLFELHSSQRYCGICISLLTSGHCLLPMLYKAMIVAFSVAVVASVSIINRHFLSATEALRFWTPLTICYTLLVVYMQGEKHATYNRNESEMLPVSGCFKKKYFLRVPLTWCFCRGAASSSQRPGSAEHSGGAPWWFDSSDADCGALGRRAPHLNMFPWGSQLSASHNGCVGCSILTGQSSLSVHLEVHNWGRILKSSLDQFPKVGLNLWNFSFKYRKFDRLWPDI